MLCVRREVPSAQEDGTHAQVPVFHLIAEGESVHRIEDHLRDEQVHPLTLHQVERLLAGACGLDFVGAGLRQHRHCGFQIVLTVHNENLHASITCLAGQAAGGIS